MTVTAIDFIKAVKFAITDGSQYMWDSYGPHAWFIDSSYPETGAISAVIDRVTGVVYEINYCDTVIDLGYKWVNPDYLADHLDEASRRNCDPWQAYDDVKYQQVVDSEDILTTIKATFSSYK